MLSPQSLAKAHAVADRFLTSSAAVVTKVRTKTTTGGSTQTTTTGTAFPARLVPIDASELTEGEEIAGTRVFWLYFPHDITFSAKNDVEVDGAMYRVTGYYGPRSDDVLHSSARVALIE